MLTLATFNLFWFPESHVPENTRSEDDKKLVARVVASLDADAITFQEILDPAALQRTLALVAGRRYHVIEEDPPAAIGELRVVIAVDSNRFEVLESVALRDPAQFQWFGRRAPLAVRLRDRATGYVLWFVGVHFKSGRPRQFVADDKRSVECALLTAWLATLRTQAPDPDVAFILGDFNWTGGPLESAGLGGPASAVTRVPGRVFTDPSGASDEVTDGDEQWSTLLDEVFIDHVFATREGHARVIDEAIIYAFDLDPALDLRRRNGYRLKPFKGAEVEEVWDVYRVSDHRPVFVRLRLDSP